MYIQEFGKNYFSRKAGMSTMKEKYICSNCGYVYDPETGDPDHNIPPGTPFEDLPDGWVCPVCFAAKDQFQKI